MQTELITYLKKHWFKATLLAIVLFVVFKKDLSFQINLNTPVLHEQVKPQSPGPVQSVKEESSQEAFTENLEQPVEAKTSSVIDRFKFSPLGQSFKREESIYEKLNEVDDDRVAAYIKRFARVAVMEQKKYDIPASIILGNALLLSKAGQSELSMEGNNHFALRCTNNWEGETGRYSKECFRHYENAWTSFRDHSLYLTTGAMGAQLKGLQGNQYKNWARALEKAGFEKGKGYGRQLILVIQDHQLYDLDE